MCCCSVGLTNGYVSQFLAEELCALSTTVTCVLSAPRIQCKLRMQRLLAVCSKHHSHLCALSTTYSMQAKNATNMCIRAASNHSKISQPKTKNWYELSLSYLNLWGSVFLGFYRLGPALLELEIYLTDLNLWGCILCGWMSLLNLVYRYEPSQTFYI